MKILSKILLPVLIAAALGMTISTVYTYEMSMDTFRKTSTNLQRMATANALVELKAGLDFNILNAISLAQTGILQPYLSGNSILKNQYAPDTRSRIVNMTNTYYYVMIGVLDTNGIALDHTETEFIGKSFQNETFYKEAMQGKVAIGAPYKYKDMVVYAVASPVYDIESTDIIGVVFNVSKLTDTMSARMLLGDMGYLFVADKYGTVFIHKDNSKVLNKKLYDFEWGIDILTTSKGNITFIDEDGREKIAYYDVLPEADWIAVAVHDINEMAAPGKTIRNNSMGITVLVLLALALIIYFYVKNIVDALLKAVQYAEQVSKGVLDKDLNLGLTQKTYTEKIASFFQKIGYTIVGKKRNSTHAKEIKDLSQFNRSDELGVLYNALQVMVHSMRNMVQRADDSNRMKSEFLANMSHEIRTPLNAVIGLAHLFLTSKENEQKKQDYVVKIEVAGKNLLGIINNVLDTSKIEAGMLELEHVHFDLRDLGDQVLTIYNDSAANKNLTLQVNIAPNMNTLYMGDPVRLGQILNNLVSNAIKFTEQGGISVTFSNEESCSENKVAPEGTTAFCITVQDTGIGFSKEQGEQLFKPFAQADASITRRFGGTGLGLAISKHLIELMQGELIVKSTPGVGTTFTIQLFLQPAEALKVQPGEEHDDGYLDLSGKRILVVEDNMINQLIMEELLQKTHAHITLADNGKIAVDKVATENFDLVLMDMQMPVMDGIQATGIIRKTHSPTELPIIAVTANAMKEDKEKGIEMGLNDYLTKPIDPKSLIITLHRWLCEPPS